LTNSFDLSKTVINKTNSYYLLTLTILAALSRFIFLVTYPFVSIGDEVRDGGLNALEIATGQIKNIFGYGRYEAHGLIIPTITSFFYKMFDGSVLVWRLPTAIFSILDIILLYILLSRITKNNIASFLGAMVLVSLPLHLFYSRTEIVVILSSFFSTLILISLFIFLSRKAINLIDYIFLGTLLGFTFNLHASIKAFSIIVLIYIVLIRLYHLLSGKVKIVQFAIGIFLLFLFLFVGFGPRLFYTTFKIFFHTTRLPLLTTYEKVNYFKIAKDIKEKYQKSLLVWIKEPTMAWYPDHKPILTPICFYLMVLGIIVSLIRKSGYLVSIFSLGLILHFTNSAVTDILNGEHRLSPLWPIGALFIGIGIAFLLSKMKLKLLQYISASVIFLYLAYQGVIFFIEQPANKNKDIGDYLSMHTIYFLKSKKKLFNASGTFTFYVSPSNYVKFNYLHYKEQYAFFLPTISITIQKGEMIKDNEIYIKSKQYNYNNKISIIKCNKMSYYGPLNYRGKILIHY